MTNQNQPYGVDISKHNGIVNFDKLAKAAPKVQFIAIRAGISWGYEDPEYVANMAGAKRLGLPRIIYHVPYFSEDAKKQVDHIMRLLEKGGFDTRYDRMAIDAELNNGMTKAGVTDKMAQLLAMLRTQTGRYPIIYSRASWVDVWLDVSKLPKVDWWLAHYLKANPPPAYTPEMTKPPALPKGVKSWFIHQTGEKGNGSEVGVVSHYVDTNRFNGTEAELLAYFGTTGGVPEPEFPKPDPVLFKAKVTATLGLRVRAGAGLSYPISATSMTYGTVVDVYEIRDGWYRHDKGGWSDGSWLVPLADNPVPPVVINEPYYGALYWQRDPRWINKPLGTSGTIGAYGCTMCCETNALNQLGISTNPMINNAWRTANGGYRNGNLINWEKVSEQHPGIVWEGRTWNPTDNQMKEKIASGCVLVILVDQNENTPELNEHWVNSVNRGDNQLWIFDPWDNQLIRLRDRYKKPILQFTEYRRVR